MHLFNFIAWFCRTQARVTALATAGTGATQALHPLARCEVAACSVIKAVVSSARLRFLVFQLHFVLVQILKGNLNLVNSTFPVLMFEPRSYLQKLADIWAYPDYINAAAAQQYPLERMKLLVTWMVAGEHTRAPYSLHLPAAAAGTPACTGKEAVHHSITGVSLIFMMQQAHPMCERQRALAICCMHVVYLQQKHIETCTCCMCMHRFAPLGGALAEALQPHPG
jgi:hypothetical protein